ncbi:MAG TPA: mechanosensitive ion channel family protein [Magnetospirillaceae bacterium]|nr:mechanosensitive ion channel family protein [Magnetospirillaceae bacterium]
MIDSGQGFIEIIHLWFAANWWMVILIFAGAWIARYVAGFFVAGVVRRTVRRKHHGDLTEEDIKKRQDTLIAMFTAMLRVLIWAVAGFSIIELIFPRLDLTPVLAGASVLGVAIGFGAQTLIKDFLSGLFIILENQYRVGDVVEIDDASGTVEQITLRSTIVRDNNGSVHYIPNGNITHAINKTMGFAKINLTIEVTASTDVDALAAIINEVGSKMADEQKWKERIIDKPHFLGIDSFTTSTLDVKIVGKTYPTAQWSVTGDLRRRLLSAFKKEGIIAAKIPTDKKK